MQELKSCPFCGERIGVQLRQPWKNMGNDLRRKDWIVDCEDCGADSGIFMEKESARKFWNRRATTPASEQERDAERFEWWFSDVDKKGFLTTYFEGMKAHWTVAEWRTAIDAAMKGKV